MKKAGIGIVGCGTVGAGVAEIAPDGAQDLSIDRPCDQRGAIALRVGIVSVVLEPGT